MAAWTKNEGSLFLLAVLLALLLLPGPGCGWRERMGQLGFFLVGLLPWLACLLVLRLLAPPCTLAAGLASMPLRELADPPGALFIVHAFAAHLLEQLAPALIVAGAALLLLRQRERPERRRQLMLPGLIAVTILAGYGVVYLMSPYPLDWHVQHSVARLALHVTPLGILGLSLLVDPAWDAPVGASCAGA
jgi:hypothetical protein